ncbi:hypothetical protein BDF22DRAFT_306268 [Syncephalis plumigaleata]|nr:hypothetical protein BDF22DRAFT_306268 [Syncephalis plumigaleata]
MASIILGCIPRGIWKVNPNVVLPYWKWSVDSQMPHASEVLSSRYFGGNGDQSRGGCLSTGYFANWGSLYVDGEDSTTVTCVTRRYDLGERMSPFYSPEAINAIIASAKTYDELRTILEGAPHGNIHVGLGGSFTSMASSSDPLFWVHHAYVDMIWWQWQKRNTKHLRDFGGVVDDSTETRDLNSIVEPFNVANGDALNTEGPGLCYRYVDYTPTSSLKQRLQHTAAASAASASSPGISTDHDVLSDVLVMDDQDPRLMQMLVDAWNTTDTPSAHGMVTSSSSSSSSSSLTNSQLLIPMDAVNSVDTAIQSSLINRLVRGDVIEHTDQAYLDAIYKAAMLNNEFQLVTQVTKDAPILVQLSTPKPLPDDYIAMNRLSRERVREGEAHLRHTISVVNQLSNYVSPASLLARQDEILRTTSDALRYGQGWAVKVIEELHPILHRFERRLRDIMHVLRQKKHH